MARFPLSSNSDWELTQPDQDIRGWEARDGDNHRLGEVTHMLVNTDTELVDVIRLDTGDEFAAEDVLIGDHVIYCGVEDARELPTAVQVQGGYGRVARRVVVHDTTFEGYDPIFRAHYRSSLAATGWVYEFFLPGYRFGYTLAAEGTSTDRTYEHVEPGAKEVFINRHGGTDYSRHRAAIRVGYEHHREQLARAEGARA